MLAPCRSSTVGRERLLQGGRGGLLPPSGPGSWVLASGPTPGTYYSIGDCFFLWSLLEIGNWNLVNLLLIVKQPPYKVCSSGPCCWEVVAAYVVFTPGPSY